MQLSIFWRGSNDIKLLFRREISWSDWSSFLPFGQLQLMSPRNGEQDPMSKGDIALAGKGVQRWCQLSEAQKRTFITLRALAASPLMMGGDLPSLDDHSLSLITNRDMLACNQNGIMGELLFKWDGVEVWRALKKGLTDTGWVGVFNRSDNSQGITVTPGMLRLEPGVTVTAYDVWNNQTLLLNDTQSQRVQIAPHDVLFLSFLPTSLAKGPISATSWPMSCATVGRATLDRNTCYREQNSSF